MKTIKRPCIDKKRKIDKRWKWVARDAGGDLFVYEQKPRKALSCWYSYDGDFGLIHSSFEKALGDIFKKVKWDDTEPTRIEE